jgi:hypothetical protein
MNNGTLQMNKPPQNWNSRHAFYMAIPLSMLNRCIPSIEKVEGPTAAAEATAAREVLAFRKEVR